MECAELVEKRHHTLRIGHSTGKDLANAREPTKSLGREGMLWSDHGKAVFDRIKLVKRIESVLYQ